MTRMQELLTWSLALVTSALAMQQLTAAEINNGRIASGLGRAIPTLPVPADDSLQALADDIVDGDVFRVGRQASRVPFDGRAGSGLPAGMPMPPAPAMMKAALTLKAIIGGPPWSGVIDGFPGRDAAIVVRAGDMIDRFQVRAVGRDTVTIQSPDSLYRLTIRSAW